MSSYRKHQTEIKLKSAYSIINNALNMAISSGDVSSVKEMVENANALGHPSAATSYFATNYLVPYLKVAKTCERQASKCELSYSTKYLNGSPLPAGAMALYCLTEKYRIQLENGMIIGIGYARADTRTTNIMPIMVDINGINGPNRFGYDIFFFSIGPWEKLLGGLFVYGDWEYSNTIIKERCMTNGIGEHCAAAIQKNSWKIPDNYPVKKW